MESDRGLYKCNEVFTADTQAAAGTQFGVASVGFISVGKDGSYASVETPLAVLGLLDVLCIVSQGLLSARYVRLARERGIMSTRV